MDIDIYDELNLRNDENIRKLINFDITEKILYSGYLKKINKKGKIQDRIALVTNLAIYNIIPNSGAGLGIKIAKIFSKVCKFLKLKRTIPLMKISAITISTNPNSHELVIHVEKEYDYRYDGKLSTSSPTNNCIESNTDSNICDKRDKFLYAICKGYINDYKSHLTLMLANDLLLEKYTTQEKDAKEGRSKFPLDLKKLDVIPEDLLYGLKILFISKNIEYDARSNDKDKEPEKKYSNYSTKDYSKFKVLEDIPITESLVIRIPDQAKPEGSVVMYG